MRPGKVTLVRDNLPALKAALDELRTARVMVGIPGDKTERQPEPGEPPTPINNATLGYIHENGAPEANIPARPFLLPGVQSAEREIVARLRDAAKAALDGKVSAVDKNLHEAGLAAQSAVKAKINEGVPPPLAETTLAARRRLGRTGDKPLVFSGQLRNAVSYVIRRGVKAPGEE